MSAEQQIAEARAWGALRAYAAAVGQNHLERRLEARLLFESLLDDVSDDARNTLGDALEAIDRAATEEVFATYVRLAAQLHGLAADFSFGADLASSAETNLFVPRTAAVLGQLEALVKSLKSGVKELKDDLANVSDAVKKEDMQALWTAAQFGKEEITELVEQLQGLADDFED